MLHKLIKNISSPSVAQKSNQEEFCLSPECIEAGEESSSTGCSKLLIRLAGLWVSLLVFFHLTAGSILTKMDQSINPCDDFYTYSCGGWLKENPIPEDSSSYGIYPWLRQHVDIKLKGVLDHEFPNNAWAHPPWWKQANVALSCLPSVKYRSRPGHRSPVSSPPHPQIFLNVRTCSL